MGSVHTEQPFKMPSLETASGRGMATLYSIQSNPHACRLLSAELAVREVEKVLLDGHEQPRCSLHTPKPRREGHTGNVGPGGGMWGGYGSEQVGISEAPDSRVAVLAH